MFERKFTTTVTNVLSPLSVTRLSGIRKYTQITWHGSLEQGSDITKQRAKIPESLSTQHPHLYPEPRWPPFLQEPLSAAISTLGPFFFINQSILTPQLFILRPL
jgi:hypothetical protein